MMASARHRDMGDPKPPPAPLPGEPARRPPPPQPPPGPPSLPPGTPRTPPKPDDLPPTAPPRGTLEARIAALEAQGSRFWAIILELCGRLPEPDPLKIAGDMVPLKVAASRSGFSESGLRARIKRGLPCRKIGGRTFLREADLP